jgi:HAD superfamily hydrolase (TIGR01509 family)
VLSPKLRAIIFDIGGVLIRMNISHAIDGLAGDQSLSPEGIWSALLKDPRWPDWQEGRINPRDWHHYLVKRLGSKLSFERFVEVWNQALDPVPIQDQGFLEKLSKKYRLAVLSNTDPLHVAYMERTYDFLGFFPARIYSCRVGTRKPSPLIYKQALQACRVRAEAAIYIDDVAEYAEAAQRLGMRSIVSRFTEQLQSDLRVLGVDTL